MPLPDFRYHPDPLATGSIKASENRCIVCDKARGYIYTSSAYGRGEYIDCICPWCIKDGSAHEQLNVVFFDMTAIGGKRMNPSWDVVPQAVKEEITYRTPGFSGWQQEHWFSHCNDAAAYLGRVGHAELLIMGEEAIRAIRDPLALDDDTWQRFFKALDKDGSPCAYLFRCLHCGTYGGYTDSL